MIDMKLVFKFLTAVILISILTTCRYEDGPAISLESSRKRIEGYYTVKSFKINNEERIEDYNNQCNCNWEFVLEDDYTHHNFFFRKCTEDSILYGDFGLVGNILTIHMGGISTKIYLGPIRTNAEVFYKVLRLTSKEIWLQTTFDGNEYMIKLAE
jgi:hypothetical protein